MNKTVRGLVKRAEDFLNTLNQETKPLTQEQRDAIDAMGMWVKLKASWACDEDSEEGDEQDIELQQLLSKIIGRINEVYPE